MSASEWSCRVVAALALITILCGSAAAFITEEQEQILQAVGKKPEEPFPGCAPPPKEENARLKYFEDLVSNSKPFKNPDEAKWGPGNPFVLEVKYTNPNDVNIAGCKLHLRSYNGKLVGDTIRAKPGDTLYIKVVNNLSKHVLHVLPQDPAPADHHEGHFSFNVTNLHTHGLHTSPEGISDNVLLTIRPGEFQHYEIYIHKNHPTGTFWYHAHLHGSTAVQVSSGMAGTLIIESDDLKGDAKGGLDTINEIKDAKANEKIFVLQQIMYGLHGQLETFEPFAPGRQEEIERLTTINGQLLPTITMRSGEVQRWRFIHAGIDKNVQLALQGHILHEVAADGIALGRRVMWRGVQGGSAGGKLPIFLAPGNRADVLVKADKPGTYYLMNGRAPPVQAGAPPPVTGTLPATVSLEGRRTAAAIATARTAEQVVRMTVGVGDRERADIQEILASRMSLSEKIDRIAEKLPDRPEAILARVVVTASSLPEMNLPSDEDLKDRVPSELQPIEDKELTGAPQEVFFQLEARRCNRDGDCSEICSNQDTDPTCRQRFMVGHRVFMPDRVRRLKLGTAAEWTLRGSGFAHPFHIHVNPFQVMRDEPEGDKAVSRKIWKDVILLNPKPTIPTTIWTRYTRYTGKFVLHCHLLDHEDQGMMELVEIVD